MVDASPPPGGGTEPAVEILDPPDSATFPACTCVLLAGTVADGEDGDLSAIVRWSSERDGDLGAGSRLSVPLSLGNHVLIASVTDHDGLTAATSIAVEIEPADGCDLSAWPPAERDLFCGGDE